MLLLEIAFKTNMGERENLPFVVVAVVTAVGIAVAVVELVWPNIAAAVHTENHQMPSWRKHCPAGQSAYQLDCFAPPYAGNFAAVVAVVAGDALALAVDS